MALHIEITIDAEDYYRIKDSEKKQDEYTEKMEILRDTTFSMEGF